VWLPTCPANHATAGRRAEAPDEEDDNTNSRDSILIILQKVVEVQVIWGLVQCLQFERDRDKEREDIWGRFTMTYYCSLAGTSYVQLSFWSVQVQVSSVRTMLEDQEKQVMLIFFLPSKVLMFGGCQSTRRVLQYGIFSDE
jgi:hypothetical protein